MFDAGPLELSAKCDTQAYYYEPSSLNDRQSF
jgi:hypothetical protein